MNYFNLVLSHGAKFGLSVAVCIALSCTSHAEAASASESHTFSLLQSAPVAETAISPMGDCGLEAQSDTIYKTVDQMPQFPGGDAGLRQYLAQTVQYPVEAQQNGIQGRIFVQFVIEADGSVSHVGVARPFDPKLDREAVRVVKSMPKWTPGKQKNKAVRVSYTVPVNFVLQ